MESNFDIAASITLKGEGEFRKSITSATSSLREISSESKLVNEQFQGQQNTMEALRSQHEVLAKSVAAHKEKEDALSKALENAKKNQETIGSSLEKLLGQWDEETEKLEELKKVYGESSDEVKEQEKKVKELSDTIKQGERNYETAGNRVQRWQTQLNNAQTETLRANRALEQNEQYLGEAEQAFDHCAASIDEFGRRVNRSTDELEESSDKVSYWGDKFASAVATKSFSIAVDTLGAIKNKAVDAAKCVIEVGTSFEAAMSSVKALSGASGSELDALADKAKELGSSTKFTATEAAEAMGNMALAGWDTKQMLNGIDGVLRLAAAGNMDLAEASDTVAGYLAAFNMEAAESSRLADVMAYAQANSKTTTDQLAEAYGTAAVNLTAAGQAMETTTAILEGLASVNDTGSAAGTKLSAVMAQITAKMQAGKIAIGDTSVTVQDSKGNFLDLIDILADIEAATDGMGDAQRSAALATTFNRTSLSALNELLNVGTEQLKKYREGLKNCDGAASDMAATMQDNLQGKVTILQSALEGLGISAYDKFSDPMQNSVEKITEVIEELTQKMNNGELGRAFGQLAENLGGSADILLDVADGLVWIIEHGDAILAVLKGIGSGLMMYKAVTAITGVVTALQSMHTALKTAESAQIALNLAQMSNPIGLVAAGVTALGVALVSLANSKMKAARTEAEKTADEIKGLSERIDGLNTSLMEQTEAQKAETAATMAQYTAYHNMVQKACELNDALSSGELPETKAAAAKAQMVYYVKQLNEQMPGLNLAIDEETGLLNQSRKAMDEYVESMKNKALASAMEEQLAELYKQQAEAQIAGAEAAEKKSQAEGAAADVMERAANAAKAYDEMIALSNSGAYAGADAQEEYAKAVEDIAKKYGVTIEEIENGYNAVQRAATETATYQAATEEAGEAIDGAREAEALAAAAIEEKSRAFATYLKELGYTTEQIAEMTGVVLENTDEMEENAEAADTAAEAMGNLAEGAIASANTQREALESLHGKYQEIRDSIEKAAASKIDMFSTFDGGDESSLSTIEQNLASQADGLEKWTANMEKLSKEIGDTITPELYQKLIELGPDAANAVNEMVDALDSASGKERVKKIAEEYGRALDASGAAGDALANMSATIQMMLGKMSNAAALDYSALEESLEGAAEAAASGGEAITEAEKSAFLEMVRAAQEIGAEIPDGLADGIASGEVSVTEAISQLKGSIQGQYDFLAEMAASAGIRIPENIQEGINQGGDAAVKAIQELQALLIGKQDEAEKSYEASGKSSTEATAKGIESGKGNVASATGNVMQAAAESGNSYRIQFESVGSNMMSGVAAGMDRNSVFISNAVKKIMQGAVNTANAYNKTNSPSKLWRDKVGRPIAEGLALGIQNGRKDAMSASVDLAKAAITGAKDELDIHSPSGLFKKLGKYISEGLGIGILDGKRYVVVQSKRMAKEVYDASAEWMKAYRKEYSVGLEQEKRFWQELAKVVKKDSASYRQARKNAAANDGFVRFVRKNTEKAFGVSWYTAKAKGTVKKDADNYYSDLTKAANKCIENKKATDNVSLQQEKYFWEQVKKSVGKGTQTYADASKKIKDINKSIRNELSSGETKADRIKYGVSGAALDLYKSLYKVSAKAEWEYWKQVRKSAGLTAEQKLEIDGKILEAKKNYYDQLGELEDEYYEKCRDVNDRLREDTADAAKNYTDALADRRAAIRGAFGLFDAFASEAEAPEVLLANMQSQAAGYALWMEQLEELEGKGILGSSFTEELRQMGPEAAATVLSLNRMTEEQLRLANKAYEEKDRLAAAQAEKELESMRAETEKKIQELEKAAQAELDGYKKEYEKASAELSAAIARPLQDLAGKATELGEKATAKLILGLKSTAESKETKRELKGIQQQIADGMANLPEKGKRVGKHTLAGILDGLSDKLEIKKGAKSFVEELEAAIKKEAGIASPSKRFRDVIGRQIPAGVAQGVREDARQAADAGTDMVNAMLKRSAEQMRLQQAALVEYMAGINGNAGIAALNSLAEAPTQPTPSVTVDNTGVADMMGGMASEIRALRGEIRRMKVMLDTGALVGEIAEPVGEALAAGTLRWR